VAFGRKTFAFQNWDGAQDRKRWSNERIQALSDIESGWGASDEGSVISGIRGGGGEERICWKISLGGQFNGGLSKTLGGDKWVKMT